MSLDSTPEKAPRGLGRALRAVLSRLRGGDLTPRRVAFSVALGLFVGCSPLFGLHALIAGGLAFAFRLDVLITYLATNISIPPVIPLLFFTELQVGTFLLNGRFHSLALSDFAPEKVLELGAAVLVGFPVVGGAVALLGGAMAFSFGSLVVRREPVALTNARDE